MVTRRVVAAGVAGLVVSALFASPAAAWPGDRVETEAVSGPTVVVKKDPALRDQETTPGGFPAGKTTYKYNVGLEVVVSNSVSKEAAVNWSLGREGSGGGMVTVGAVGNGAEIEGNLGGSVSIGGSGSMKTEQKDDRKVTTTAEGSVEIDAFKRPHTGHRVSYDVHYDQYTFRQRTCNIFGSCSEWKQGTLDVPRKIVANLTFLGWTNTVYSMSGTGLVLADPENPKNVGKSFDMSLILNLNENEYSGDFYLGGDWKGKMTVEAGSVKESEDLKDLTEFKVKFFDETQGYTHVVRDDPSYGNHTRPHHGAGQITFKDGFKFEFTDLIGHG